MKLTLLKQRKGMPEIFLKVIYEQEWCIPTHNSLKKILFQNIIYCTLSWAKNNISKNPFLKTLRKKWYQSCWKKNENIYEHLWGALQAFNVQNNGGCKADGISYNNGRNNCLELESCKLDLITLVGYGYNLHAPILHGNFPFWCDLRSEIAIASGETDDANPDDGRAKQEIEGDYNWGPTKDCTFE